MVEPAVRTRAVAALVFNAFVWGISWWPLRALHAHGLHPLWSTALVYAIVFVGFTLLRPRALADVLRQPALWLLAMAAGLTNIGFNWAVTIGDVVRVVLLFYLMPAWSLLLAWAILGERPTPAGLLRLLLALAGVAAVLGAGGSLPLPRGAADWLALMGGFSFALTNVLLRRLHAVPPGARLLAMFGGGMTMATTLALLLGLGGAVPGFGAMAPAGWIIALLLSGGFLLSNLALQYGAPRLAAHTTALVMLSEVVFASLSSVAAGAARLESRTLAGGALILAAAAWSAWPSAARKRNP